jgi:uncharacterized RDD family membrane protein YckC
MGTTMSSNLASPLDAASPADNAPESSTPVALVVVAPSRVEAATPRAEAAAPSDDSVDATADAPGDALDDTSTEAAEAPRIVCYYDEEEDFSAYAPATFNQRAYAAAIDLAMFVSVALMVAVPAAAPIASMVKSGNETTALGVVLVLAGVLAAAYLVLPTTLYGRTFGKAVVGLRVVGDDYAKLSLPRVLLREVVGKAASLLPVGAGFVLPVLNTQRRALHDFVGRTRVVLVRPQHQQRAGQTVLREMRENRETTRINQRPLADGQSGAALTELLGLGGGAPFDVFAPTPPEG